MQDRSATTRPFRELTVGEFVDRLASAEPVPGGGSASAVAASLAAGLVAMVAELSRDRPKYADHADLHDRSVASGRRLAAQLLDLATLDADAYAEFAAALKLPRADEAAKETRAATVRAAARRAAEVPLQCVEACLEVVAAAESLAGRSNTNASSDLAVAALLADAAARGAAQNVLVNLKAAGDEAFAAQMTTRVDRLLHQIGPLAGDTRTTVAGGEPRPPVDLVDVPG